jgi:hypothetical protein
VLIGLVDRVLWNHGGFLAGFGIEEDAALVCHGLHYIGAGGWEGEHAFNGAGDGVERTAGLDSLASEPVVLNEADD